MKEELFGLTEEEYILLKNLNTPSKIQDLLNNLKINFEEQEILACRQEWF